ncbi:glycosyltransferase family A protein [Glutamicibacter sp. MNS18]|uniref:glycosyltransferase family 2 protein n=1 Tax=Glutamicibacter sp. MNS18 TaxID=2989817 RepID=UPI00278C4294|nr:glycosyltransferase family A protein [Glutamicibacter sp. MNS18]
MTTLSVVVPVLDDAVHLRSLLQALALQCRLAEEVIVVDNGCSDDSAALARQAGAMVVTEPRRGIGPAAATGYDHATGSIVVRCDADTLPPAHWLERIAGRFERDPQLGALTGPGYFTDLPAGARAAGSLFYTAAYFGGYTAALARTPLWGSNMAFRRDLWPAVRPGVHLQIPHIHDDLDFSCNLPAGTRVRFDPGLRVGAAGRVFTRAGGLGDSVRRARATLAANGGRDLVFARWHAALGLPAGR